MSETTIAWPANLPAPLVSGYGVNPAEGIVRTNMDSGLARQRRIFTQTPTVFDVTWFMAKTQYQLFEGWYLHSAKEGAAQFTISLASGQGIVPHTARFLGQFNATLLAQNLWQITAQLETINRPVASKEWLEVAQNNDLDALYAAIDRYGVVLQNTILNREAA